MLGKPLQDGRVNHVHSVRRCEHKNGAVIGGIHAVQFLEQLTVHLGIDAGRVTALPGWARGVNLVDVHNGRRFLASFSEVFLNRDGSLPDPAYLEVGARQ